MTIRTQPKLLKRTIATLIDYALYLSFFVWLIISYGDPNDEGGYTLSNDPKLGWIYLVWFAYFPMIEAIAGRTLGKFALGLRVVAKTGRPITFLQAFKRHLLDPIDFVFYGIVAFITIKNSTDHQRVGDIWAGTIVVSSDDFKCSNCGEQVELNAGEIQNRAFTCPACGTSNTI